MRILFLDLASHNGLLSCVKEEKTLSVSSVDHRIDDRALVPLLEETMKKAGWTYADLTHLACVIGPGGFTSLRVAVSAANALSYTLGVPVAGVQLSDLYEAISDQRLAISTAETGLSLIADRLPLIWLHSTKKHELFVRGFGDLAKEFPEAICVTLDDLFSRVTSKVEWMGELIPEHRKRVEERGWTEASLRPVQEILPKFLSGQTYEKKTVVPWYGRGW